MRGNDRIICLPEVDILMKFHEEQGCDGILTGDDGAPDLEGRDNILVTYAIQYLSIKPKRLLNLIQ